MRKWNLPLTYEPKIQSVIDGICRQTIRAVRTDKQKKKVGDLVRFYVWLGKPYHSKRKTITEYMPLTEVLPLKIFVGGVLFPSSLGGDDWAQWQDLNNLAERDGIVPPVGYVLRNVLLSKNKIDNRTGLECQILRW